jgi:hypothetical protein
MRMPRTAGVLAGAVLLLAGCTGGGTADPDLADAATVAAATTCQDPASRPDGAAVTEARLEGDGLVLVPDLLDEAPAVVLIAENLTDVTHGVIMVKGTINEDTDRDPRGALKDFGPFTGAGRVVARIDGLEPGERCEVHLRLGVGSFSIFSDAIVDGVAVSSTGALAWLSFGVEPPSEGPGGPPAGARP